MKLGLVFAGGGARGSYQIGAWKALKELGIDKYVKGVSGTSIGALNAVMYLQGDIEIAEKVWLSISKDKILPTGNIDLLKRGIFITLGNRNLNFVKKYLPTTLEQGNISRSGLIEIMNQYVDIEKIRLDKRSCYATCSSVPDLSPRYFKLNDYNDEDIKNILLATSAIPMIYESKEVEEFKYLDGGMADNVPVQPLYGEGLDIIIIIHLSKDSLVNRYKFPRARIIEIYPRDMADGDLAEILDFSSSGIRKRMKQGYIDTMYLLEPIITIANYQRDQLPKETIIKAGLGIVEKSRGIFKKKTEEKSDIDEDKDKISG